MSNGVCGSMQLWMDVQSRWQLVAEFSPFPRRLGTPRDREIMDDTHYIEECGTPFPDAVASRALPEKSLNSNVPAGDEIRVPGTYSLRDEQIADGGDDAKGEEASNPVWGSHPPTPGHG